MGSRFSLAFLWFFIVTYAHNTTHCHQEICPFPPVWNCLFFGHALGFVGMNAFLLFCSSLWKGVFGIKFSLDGNSKLFNSHVLENVIMLLSCVNVRIHFSLMFLFFGEKGVIVHDSILCGGGYNGLDLVKRNNMLTL